MEIVYNAPMRVPLWLKIGWTIWVLVWTPLYLKQYGAQNFLFFCDLGNILVAVALWRESRLIFSWQAVGLLLLQTLFTVDLLSAALLGKHLIGGTEYMFDRGIPLDPLLYGTNSRFDPQKLVWIGSTDNDAVSM